jgi:hypothetical protein
MFKAGDYVKIVDDRLFLRREEIVGSYAEIEGYNGSFICVRLFHCQHRCLVHPDDLYLVTEEEPNYNLFLHRRKISDRINDVRDELEKLEDDLCELDNRIAGYEDGDQCLIK